MPGRVASGCEKGQPVYHGRHPGPSSSGHKAGVWFFSKHSFILLPPFCCYYTAGYEFIVILQAPFSLHLAVGIVYWTAIPFITGLHREIPGKVCFETACHNVTFFPRGKQFPQPLAISVFMVIALLVDCLQVWCPDGFVWDFSCAK